MKTAVCTLFEGDYHHGVATLVNSLCRNRFFGEIFAGYRGTLPKWASCATHGLDGSRCMIISSEITLTFLPLDPKAHFTNFKPDFMLNLLEGAAKEADYLVYADPDLVFDAPWSHFSDLLQLGILLCEDVNSPMSRKHPIRAAWKRYFPDLAWTSSTDLFLNAGFLGLPRVASKLLDRWKEMNARIADIVGGSKVTGLNGSGFPVRGYAACFSQPDQDALNALVDTSPELEFFILGREAMGFSGPQAILPHAIGSPKPWCKKYLWEALLARPPTVADKAFWNYAEGTLTTFSQGNLHAMRARSALASLIGRFYRRK